MGRCKTAMAWGYASGGCRFLFEGMQGYLSLIRSSRNILRMSLVMIEDETLGPVDVGFLAAVGVVLEPDGVAYTFDKLSAGLIEQPPFGSLCHANVSGDSRILAQ